MKRYIVLTQNKETGVWSIADTLLHVNKRKAQEYADSLTRHDNGQHYFVVKSLKSILFYKEVAK